MLPFRCAMVNLPNVSALCGIGMLSTSVPVVLTWNPGPVAWVGVLWCS